MAEIDRKRILPATACAWDEIADCCDVTVCERLNKQQSHFTITINTVIKSVWEFFVI